MTNLGIITGGGPAHPGFNEFTPLFERNQAQLNLSGVVGSNWTRANEAVVSGIYDNISVSAGQFHYQSDGFRANNDLNYDIYGVFDQAAITPKLNMQAEIRRAASDFGDLDFDFWCNSFNKSMEQEVNQSIACLGVRYSFSPKSIVIGSVIYECLSNGLQNNLGLSDLLWLNINATSN